MSTYTHALATNQFGCAAFIVDATASNGTHTTITSALAAAVSGQTIFIKPGTYTENLTLKAGVNLTAFECDGITPNVTIVGKCTFTAAGVVTMSGIRLQTNSDFCLSVTGSAASVVELLSCYINAANNTAIQFTSSSASANIVLQECQGNIATTGITFFSASSAGTVIIQGGLFANTGNSTTANSFASTGTLQLQFVANFQSALAISSTCSFSINNSRINTASLNIVAIAHTSTSALNTLYHSELESGTAAAMTIGAGATVVVDFLGVGSSNAAVLSGAGIIKYGLITYTSTGSTNTVGTQTALTTQPAFGGGGTFVKQVRASTTTAGSTTTVIPYDDSIPQIGEGAEVLTVSITPANTNNILVIEYNFMMTCVANNAGSRQFSSAIFQDATANALYAQLDFQTFEGQTATNAGIAVSGRFYMTAGTTSATTFRLRVGPAVNTYTYYWLSNVGSALFSTVNPAVITVSEYSA